MHPDEIVREIMDAQADLQTGLGIFRVDALNPNIENRLAKSLARLHTLLDNLGNPMFDCAKHPDVPPGPTNHTHDRGDTVTQITTESWAEACEDPLVQKLNDDGRAYGEKLQREGRDHIRVGFEACFKYAGWNNDDKTNKYCRKPKGHDGEHAFA